jgi:hypothetical protein
LSNTIVGQSYETHHGALAIWPASEKRRKFDDPSHRGESVKLLEWVGAHPVLSVILFAVAIGGIVAIVAVVEGIQVAKLAITTHQTGN